MLSDTIEEYLEAIFRLQEHHRPVGTSELARHLNVSAPSATDMIKKLARRKLVHYQPYYGITFTPKGRKEAVRLVRRHRLSERFLTDILGLGWDEVHNEACRFEHVLSKNVEDRLDKTLGKPKTCPHGNPIPSLKGKVVEKAVTRLSSLKPKEKGTIAKITEESPKLLRYLASLGLMPEVAVQVQEVAPFGGPSLIKLKGASYALGRDVSDRIWVHKK